MSNLKKKKFSTSIFSPTAVCGSCGKLKLSDIVQPNAKPAVVAGGHHHPRSKSRLSSSSSGDRNDGPSLDDEYLDCSSTGLHSPQTIVIGDSIAVEKDSDDPYEDFRHSMLQMIIEKRIYSTNGLQELLDCFLHLNSPCHHEIILTAFTQISNEFLSHRLWITNNNSDGKPSSTGEGCGIGEMARATAIVRGWALNSPT